MNSIDQVIDKLMLMLPDVKYLDIWKISGITDISSFSLSKLKCVQRKLEIVGTAIEMRLSLF